MATTHPGELGRRSANRMIRAGTSVPLPALLAAAILAIGACCFIAYVLWPRWPTPLGSDAPSLPITIAGIAFNVPPAAIRVTVQRRPGAHERVDLAFLWPSLAPPDRTETPEPVGPDVSPIRPIERIFVTISIADDTLAPDDRVKSIYPRYAAAEPIAGPPGLAVLPFRPDTPYQGEDLVYDARQPANFLVRCSRNGAGPTPGICLYARRIETADIVVRFPRDWLVDWHAVKDNIERLIASLRPHQR